MEGEKLLSELAGQLERCKCLRYDMRKMNDKDFWDFWKTNGEPNVHIIACHLVAAESIPNNASIVVFRDRLSTALLPRVAHVKNVTFTDLYDYEADGYDGHAQIDTIILTGLSHYNALPECSAYKISSRTQLETLGNFDCNGKELRIDDILESREGLYREISQRFTNFCELAINIRLVPQLHKEAPELTENPNILLSVRGIYNIPNLELLAGIPIAKLELCGHIDNIDPDYFVNLQVGVIVEYDECFGSLVKMAITRLKKTKRCIS